MQVPGCHLKLLHKLREPFLLVNEHAVEKIRPISQIILRRQKTLLGHVLRADPEDPMFCVSFNENIAIVADNTRRSGKPRQHFLETNLGRVYWELFEDIYDDNILCHREIIVGKTRARQF